LAHGRSIGVPAPSRYSWLPSAPTRNATTRRAERLNANGDPHVRQWVFSNATRAPHTSHPKVRTHPTLPSKPHPAPHLGPARRHISGTTGRGSAGGDDFQVTARLVGVTHRSDGDRDRASDATGGDVGPVPWWTTGRQLQVVGHRITIGR
jgi:hypothetical protein